MYLNFIILMQSNFCINKIYPTICALYDICISKRLFSKAMIVGKYLFHIECLTRKWRQQTESLRTFS